MPLDGAQDRGCTEAVGICNPTAAPLARPGDGPAAGSFVDWRVPPPLHDPAVEAYPVEVAAVGEVVDATGPQSFCVRIVAAARTPCRGQR